MDEWMDGLIKHIPNDSHVTMNMHYSNWAIRVGVVLFTPYPHSSENAVASCHGD